VRPLVRRPPQLCLSPGRIVLFPTALLAPLQMQDPVGMPPLIETKPAGLVALVDAAAAMQPEPIQEETSVALPDNAQAEQVGGNLQDGSVMMNAEVPMDIPAGYELVMTEDGTQFLIQQGAFLEDGSPAYYQIQTEGDEASFDMSALGGEQTYFIVQPGEAGELVDPNEMGIDLEQYMALQQQQQGMVDGQQPVDGIQEVQMQDPNQSTA